MKKLTALLLTLVLASCAYQFGDLSKAYCAATTPVGKALAKKALGITVPVDYCVTVGLVEILTTKGG